MKKSKELELAGVAAGLHMMKPTTSRADELIACLEGEVKSRDARIAELEGHLLIERNDYETLMLDAGRLASELAALKAQEPVAWMLKNEKGRIEEILPYIPCDSDVQPYWPEPTPLYAAPVSEAKAQGVVMQSTDGGRNPRYEGLFDGETEEQRASRLNADPVKQVSVPNGWRLELIGPDEVVKLSRKDGKWCGITNLSGSPRDGLLYPFLRAMLAAEPAPGDDKEDPLEWSRKRNIEEF